MYLSSACAGVFDKTRRREDSDNCKPCSKRLIIIHSIMAHVTLEFGSKITCTIVILTMRKDQTTETHFRNELQARFWRMMLNDLIIMFRKNSFRLAKFGLIFTLTNWLILEKSRLKSRPGPGPEENCQIPIEFLYEFMAVYWRGDTFPRNAEAPFLIAFTFQILLEFHIN